QSSVASLNNADGVCNAQIGQIETPVRIQPVIRQVSIHNILLCVPPNDGLAVLDDDTRNIERGNVQGSLKVGVQSAAREDVLNTLGNFDYGIGAAPKYGVEAAVRRGRGCTDELKVGKRGEVV